MMFTRPLGDTGFEVSAVSLGAWQIGGRGYGPVPEADGMATIDAYLRSGGNFIDTARRYGESERILGTYFRRHGGREDVYIASKSHRLGAAAIRAELAETLELLGTDYLDLYYLHAPPEAPEQIEETLSTYVALKREGQIRAIGASIKGPDVSQRTVDLSRRYIASGEVDALMLIVSIFRQANAAVFDEAQEAGVGIVARTALESGFLSGKYAPGHAFAKERDHRRRWGQGRLEAILAEAQQLKEDLVKPPYESLAQVAVRFVLDYGPVSSVVVGARTPEQITGSVHSADLPPLADSVRQQIIADHRGRDSAYNTGP